MKLSSRKQLLAEAEAELKKIKTKINEARNTDAFDVFTNKLQMVIDQYSAKRKNLDKMIQQLKLSVFTKNIAMKIANDSMVGKTLRELQPNLLSAPEMDSRIRKIIHADFTGDTESPDEDIYTELGFHIKVELENGKVIDHTWEGTDLFY